MRLLVGIKCWWQGDWIEYVLRSIYDAAWKIKVVHGPVKVMFLAGFKNDDTLDKARAFPDPDGKIDIQTAAYWPSIVDMANATLDYEADFYLKLDGDEVPSEAWLDEFFEKMPEAQRMDLPITSNYYHVIGDFKHQAKGPISEYRMRGFPLKEKPVFHHPDGVIPYFKEIQMPSLKMENRLHHYNWVRSYEAIMIHRAYQRLNWWGWTPPMIRNLRFRPDFEKMVIDHLENYQKDDWPIEPMVDDHPEVVKQHPLWPDGVSFENAKMDWDKVLRSVDDGTIPRE
jgi:hypothetical protein